MNCTACPLRTQMMGISKYVFYIGVLQIDTLESKPMAEWTILSNQDQRCNIAFTIINPKTKYVMEVKTVTFVL